MKALLFAFLLSTTAVAKTIPVWALLQYEASSDTWVIQGLYPTKAECERWREVNASGMPQVCRPSKPISAPPDSVSY
jgi:hypothetical protein